MRMWGDARDSFLSIAMRPSVYCRARMVISKNKKVAPLAADAIGSTSQYSLAMTRKNEHPARLPKGDLTSVGINPLVNPLTPCFFHVWLKQSIMPV